MRALPSSLGTAVLLLALAPPSWVRADAKGPRVAVLGFEDASTAQGYSALGKGLQSMLTTDLAKVPEIKLVERSRLEDVKAEIARSRGRAFDAKSAAKVGKLLGASHLLVGTFAGVGEDMRVDARLVGVKEADVVLAEQVAGERDAFFELEKDLAKKVIRALEVSFPARIRGEVAQLHTTDYQAFKRFSDGLERFDQGRYDEAIRALKDAARMDDRFALAKTTLGELEELREAIRQRKDVVKEAEDAARERALSAEAQAIDAWLGKLERKALKGKTRADRVVARRILASAMLAEPRGLKAWWDAIDRFAARRRGDAWARAFYDEAFKAWPASPLKLRDRLTFQAGHSYVEIFPLRPGRGLPDLDKHWTRLKKSWANDPVRRVTSGWEFIEGMARWGRTLHSSRRAASHLTEDALRTVTHRWKSPHPAYDKTLASWRARQTIEVAQRYLHDLALDDAARVMAVLGRASKDSKVLAQVEGMVQAIALTKRRLGSKELKHPRWSEEYFRQANLGPIGAHNVGVRLDSILGQAEGYFGSEDSVRNHWQITKIRRLWHCSDTDYVLLGQTPVWARQQCERLLTGARPDPWQTDELRYELEGRESRMTTSDKRDYDEEHAIPSLLIAGSEPVGDVAVRTALGFTPPPDHNHYRFSSRHKEKPNLASPPRATAGLLFGARNIDAGTPMGWNDEPRAPEAPLRAWMLVVRADRLALVRLIETLEDGQHGSLAFEETAIAEVRLPGDLPEPFDLELRVKGKRVEARAGSAHLEATLDARPSGFAGLYMGGVGFCRWGPLDIEPLGR